MDHERAAERLEELCAAQPFHTGWAVADPGSGARAEGLGDRPVPAASTRKVAILMAALAGVHAGRLDLEERVVLDGTYRDRVFTGLTQHLAPGLDLSLRDALTLMIIVSDNLCTAHVLERVGLEAVNDLCAAAGLDRTAHVHALIPKLEPDHPVKATNWTTPGDQLDLLLAILRGAEDAAAARRLGCDPALCRLAIDILRRQQYRDGIARLLPAGTVVAGKSGAGWRDVSDLGVVYPDVSAAARYVLVVYTDDVPPMIDDLRGTTVAQAHIAALGRACWEAFAGAP